jgi:hypothetical protein
MLIAPGLLDSRSSPLEERHPSRRGSDSRSRFRLHPHSSGCMRGHLRHNTGAPTGFELATLGLDVGTDEDPHATWTTA